MKTETTIIRMGAEFVNHLDAICDEYKSKVSRRLTREEALKRLIDRDPYLISICKQESLNYFHIEKD